MLINPHNTNRAFYLKPGTLQSKVNRAFFFSLPAYTVFASEVGIEERESIGFCFKSKKREEVLTDQKAFRFGLFGPP